MVGPKGKVYRVETHEEKGDGEEESPPGWKAVGCSQRALHPHSHSHFEWDLYARNATAFSPAVGSRYYLLVISDCG